MTLTVPLVALNQVPRGALRMAGAGPAEGEGAGCSRSTLPQQLRHKLGPLPEFAEAFAAARCRRRTTPLAAAIARYIARAN